MGIAAAAEVLTDLHTRLHALPARLSREPGDRILHLDLHPDNVVLTAHGPVLIDWRNAGEGPPDLDVALTALIIAQVAVGLGVAVMGPAARLLLTEFLSRTGGELLAMLDRAARLRTVDPNLTCQERARVAEAADLVRANRWPPRWPPR